ncbi:MAG: transposase [Candidatus Binatia bacterium]
MSRRLRFVPPGSLVEITCRTIQGRLLLRPSPGLVDLTVGVLARAARLYPVEIHAFAFLSNHYHLLLTAPSAQRLSAFMNYLNSNLAREAGRLVRWREKFWGRRYQAILVSSEPEAQVSRLRYLLSHGAKEGLVASPLDWPGAHCANALLEGTPISGRWQNRTLELRAQRTRTSVDSNAFVEHELLLLAPLPCWRRYARDEQRQLAGDLVSQVEAEARARFADSGRPPLGRQAVCAQNPHLEPIRIKRGCAPLAHAASQAARRALLGAYRRFVDSYHDASSRLRRGLFDAEFPEGSFPPALPFRPARDG